MTEEEKDLLIKDLSCRLPYNVKVHAKYTDLGEIIELDGIVKMIDDDGVVGIEVINDFASGWTYVQIDDVKPYLFPLSSMTEAQNKELQALIIQNTFGTSCNTFTTQDFYCKYHLDYRGLILIGLANDLTNLNVY